MEDHGHAHAAWTQCVCVCILCACVCMYVCMYLYVCMYVCLYVCLSLCLYRCCTHVVVSRPSTVCRTQTNCLGVRGTSKGRLFSGNSAKHALENTIEFVARTSRTPGLWTSLPLKRSDQCFRSRVRRQIGARPPPTALLAQKSAARGAR